MSKLKKLNKLNKSKTLSVAMSVGLVAANLVNAVPAMAVTHVSAHTMSSRTTIDPSKTQTFDKKDPQDVSVTYTVPSDEYELQAVKNGSKTLEEGQDYFLDGDTVTVSQDYLMAQKTGTVSLKLDFNKGTDPTMRISVKDNRAAVKLSTTKVDAKHLKDISATLTLHGDTFTGIEGLAEDTDYTVKNTKVTISKDYLETLADGENHLIFNFEESPSVDLAFTVSNSEVAPSAKLQGVVAGNGTLTATFDQDLDDTFDPADLVIKKDGEVITSADEQIDGDKVVIKVDEVPATDAAQDIVYSVTYKGVTKSDTLHVDGKTAPVVTTVNITTAAGASVTVGGATTTLTAEVKDQYGAAMTGQTIVWTSSDPTKATVDANGVVTAVAAGSVNITAAVGSVTSAQYAVTVNAAILAISSVSSTNATTVVATLSTPTTGKIASDFVVKVNDTVVTPSAVTSDATGANYTLTIPTIDNTSGTIDVNGKTTAFDYVAPSVGTATALSSTQIKVTFNTAVDKATAETNTYYTVRKVVDVGAAYGSPNPTSVVLAADGKSATLTMDPGKAFIDAPQGYLLQISANNIKAANNAKKIAASERIFDGVGTVDASKPTIIKATLDSANNQLIVEFNKTLSLVDSDVDETKFTITGSGTGQSYALTESMFSTATNGSKITFALPSADVTSISAYTNISLSMATGAVKDTNSTPATNDAQTLSIAVAAKPQLTGSSYNQATNQLTLTFASTVNISKFDKTLVGITNTGGTSIAALGSSDTVNTTANGTSVVITLSSANAAFVEATGVSARSVTLNANAATNTDGLTNITQTLALTYVADTVLPQLVSAEYNDLSNLLILTFDKDMDQTDGNINQDNIKISTDNGTTTALDVEASASPVTQQNPKKILIDLSGETELATFEGSTIDRSKLEISYPAGTFRDTAGNLSPAVAYTNDKALTYTDLTKPQLQLTDDSGNDLIGYTGTDTLASLNSTTDATHINVDFDSKVTAATATNAANYTVSLRSNPSVTFAVSSAILDANRTSVVLTVADMSSYVGQAVKVTVNNVADDAGNVINTSGYGANGNFYNVGYVQVAGAVGDTTGPTVASAAFVDGGSGNAGTVGAGDILEVTFSENIYLKPGLSESDFKLLLSGVTTPTFGSGAQFAVKTGAPRVLQITLGSGTNITKTAVNDGTSGNRLSIDIKAGGSSNITDVYGNNAGTGAQTVAQYTGDTKPYITGAVYADSNGDGKVGKDDTLTLTFNETVGLTGTFAANWLTYSSHTIDLTGASAPTVSGNTVAIKLGSGSTTLVPGTDTLYYNAGNGDAISDAWSNEADDGTSVKGSQQAIKVTSADVVQPNLVSAEYINADAGTGETTVEVGDQIVMAFSEPVHVATTLANNSFFLYNGGATNNLAFTGITGWAVSQPDADKKKVLLTNIGDTTSVIIPGQTGINAAASGVANIKDASENTVKQNASVVTLTSSGSSQITTALDADGNGTADYAAAANGNNADGKFYVDANAGNVVIYNAGSDLRDRVYLVYVNGALKASGVGANNSNASIAVSGLAASDKVKVAYVKNDGWSALSSEYTILPSVNNGTTIDFGTVAADATSIKAGLTFKNAKSAGNDTIAIAASTFGADYTVKTTNFATQLNASYTDAGGLAATTVGDNKGSAITNATIYLVDTNGNTTKATTVKVDATADA